MKLSYQCLFVEHSYCACYFNKAQESKHKNKTFFFFSFLFSHLMRPKKKKKNSMFSTPNFVPKKNFFFLPYQNFRQKFFPLSPPSVFFFFCFALFHVIVWYFIPSLREKKKKLTIGTLFDCGHC